jgi:hypothetical protein
VIKNAKIINLIEKGVMKTTACSCIEQCPNAEFGIILLNTEMQV